MSRWFEAAPIRSDPLAPPGLRGWAGQIATLLRSLGPYAAIELLLPGGSLLALLLWLYRRHRRARAAGGTCIASVRQLGEQGRERVEVERLDEVRVEAGLA